MEIVKRINAIALVQSKDWFKELTEGIANLKISTDLTIDLKIETDLEKFVAYVQANTQDCFFLDLNYSTFSAVEMAERLRKSQKYKKAPLFFIADKRKAGEINTLRYSNLNIDMVISWPSPFSEFAQPLSTILKKRFSSIIPSNYKVLIMDDNFEIVYIMKTYMMEMGHDNFETCTTLAEARQLVQKNDYDILLLDWNLSDGTCIDLIEFMREKKEKVQSSKGLIMVLTGRNSVEDIMTLVNYNIKDYIIKPFEFDEFEEKLIYALEKYTK